MHDNALKLLALVLAASACSSTDPAATSVATATSGAGGAGGSTAVGGSGGGQVLPTCARETSDTLAFAPAEAPLGATREEWIQRWWQWHMALPGSANPTFTPNAPCDSMQTAPAWFLGGTGGVLSTRSCTIPSGIGLLVPVGGLLSTTQPETECEPAGCDPDAAERYLQDTAAGANLESDVLCLEVDGVALANPHDYLLYTGLFTFQLHPDDPIVPEWGTFGPNNCGGLCIEGNDRHGIAAGYWIMLPALPSGTHTLRYFDAVPDGSWVGETTYELTVQ